MVTVSTTTQLEQAIESHENEILIEGDLVKNFRKHKKTRQGFIIGSIALMVLGFVFTKPTNGLSLIGLAVGIIVCIATFVFRSLPFAVPFAIYTAGAKNAMKVLKSGKAWINSDGTVVARLKYK